MNEKVFSYLRTSTQDQELGIEKQRRKIRELADTENYSIEKEFENQISGMKEIAGVNGGRPHIDFSERPELMKLYEEAMNREDVEKILIYSPSRLARKLRPQLLLSHIFKESDLKIEYVEVPDSWIGKIISSVMDEEAVRRTRKRTKQVLEQKQENDEWIGRPPTGFKTVERHSKLVAEDWLDDLLDAVHKYRKSSESRKSVAQDYGDEISPSRMKSIEQNMNRGRPDPKHVKSDRRY